MLTELPGKFFGVDGDDDVALIYLPMSIGWDGSPSRFAVFGEAITLIRRAHGVSNSQWNGQEPPKSRLYLGDGIFIEVIRNRRMAACAYQWGALLMVYWEGRR